MEWVDRWWRSEVDEDSFLEEVLERDDRTNLVSLSLSFLNLDAFLGLGLRNIDY